VVGYECRIPGQARRAQSRQILCPEKGTFIESQSLTIELATLGGHGLRWKDCGIAWPPVRCSMAAGLAISSQLICQNEASRLTMPCSAAKMR